MVLEAREPAPYEVVIADHIKRVLSAASGTSREAVERLCSAVEALYYAIPSEFRNGIPDPLERLGRVTDGQAALVDDPQALRREALRIFSELVDSLHKAGVILPVRRIIYGYEESEG